MSSVQDLERTLEANRALQEQIRKELEVLARRKARNRERSAELKGLLCATASRLEPPTATKGSKSNWNRFFCTDASPRYPEPNADTVKRRELEKKGFFHHLQPPWSKSESTALTELGAGTDDFDKVSRSLHQHASSGEPLQQPRTAEECRVQYKLLTERVPPFTKKESVQISEQVHLSERPDWQKIGSSLNRSAWDCFVAYQTKLKPVQSTSWTLSEDRLLLKYIAAAGPQFVVDVDSVRQLSARLFHKPKNQVLLRANHSLVNPNLRHDAWSEDEQRRLIVGMKVYRDSPQTLYLAGTHFPGRSNKSVTDKWKRGLNPQYSTRPFNKEENERLVKVTRENPTLGWTELSSRYFPDRHPHRLASRWSEVAKDTDILARSGESLVRQKRAASAEKGAALEATDYVVHVKKKPGRSRK